MHAGYPLAASDRLVVDGRLWPGKVLCQHQSRNRCVSGWIASSQTVPALSSDR